MRRWLCALALCLLGHPASAQDEPDAGTDTDDSQRRAIRGAPVERATPNPGREALRQFEREAFVPGAPRTPVAADAGPPDRQDLPWLKDLHTGDIPVRWDDRVIEFLRFYHDDPRGRAIMAGWLRAQGRYQDLILDALRRHHLPEDLLYDCMIESSYDPLDLSRVGASGLWQFMPEGGRIYGLRQDYWLDERNDPEKANEAQMSYFADLIERFGNWDLALAAFNAGYGAVLKSVAKYGTNDFWALLDLESGLPWESGVYVPKFLAAAIIGHNRHVFGFDDVVPDAPWSFDRVTVPRSVDLGTIARAAGVDVKVVKALNPALRRGRTPPGVPDFQVRIPTGTKAQFARTFPQLESEWAGTETYVLRHGERFEDVARTFGLSVAKLRALNGVKDVVEVRGGTILVVPKIDAAVRAENARKADDDLYHSDVVPGAPDEPLLVAVKDKDLQIEGKKRVFYRVVAGDTLEDVAAALGVGTRDLADWNGLDEGTKIQVRMVLMAFVPEGFDAGARGVALLDDARILVVTAGSPEHLDIYEGRKGRVRDTVTVKAGDTLESIGRRYTLTQYDVARINHRSYVTPLEPGETLVVYKIVDRAKAKKAGVFKGSVEARSAKSKKKPAAHKGKKH
jgi:membrane-bound lytic murein transglycosylase D